ncbi:FUSC family protein [Commensalibacter nepenthis]|uniref:FUSC family protein n=1 Tax=Commensalibacter nepenthis TaxID=3043872 RepID=A0ABT6Q6R7_9PROT|nr:FUSC family protein [Commensalibacter sp. TBRC 10068]MDI2112035.1 FUSC family protein [Commensalibacter sp. TBRC 10068]
MKSYSWLYAPPKEAIFFTLRTLLASYLALAIALWMELDSPKWAMMTVWIVAQTSPGETISKARWRVVGTLVGVSIAILMAAAFPQQPVLFGVGLAVWMGCCCWIASLMRNSSSYGVVLAGYTCALIGLSTSSNPDGIFMMAMSRGSYIILGVLCQTFIERVFALNMREKSQAILFDKLSQAVSGALTVIGETLKGDYQAAFKVQKIFAAVSAFQSSVEFRKEELMRDDRTIDHVYAILSSISVVLTRLINLTIYMNYFEKDIRFQNIIAKIQKYLDQLIVSVKQDKNFQDHLKSLSQLRWDCRQIITDYIYEDTNAIQNSKNENSLLNLRILYRSLSELLGEIEVIIIQYQKAINPNPKDKFRFSLPSLYNFKLAWGNLLRVFIAVIVACFLWEITAWDELSSAIGLLCVACGRLCLFENAYKMCIGFFKGVIVCVLAAWLIDVTLMPLTTSIEMVFLMLFIPLFIGGLAIYHLPTRGIGMSFTIFFPFLVIVSNQSRMDEVTFLNTTLAVVCGVGLAAMAFRFVAPYSPQKVRREIRSRMLHSIRELTTVSQNPNHRRWLASTMDWFVSLMRQFDPVNETILIQKYNHGALAVMSIGLNIMELRSMIDHDVLPEDIKNELRVVMRRIQHFQGGRLGRTVLIIKSAVRRLRAREGKERNLAKRLEITEAIAYLTLIFFALDKNAAFLNPSYRLYNRD